MSGSAAAAVEYVGVQKRYGETVALTGVDFVIRRGEFFGLLGRNGAGKSTLINITAGLTRSSAGHVAVMGHDTIRSWRKARRLLGVVPQELVLDPYFNVTDMLRIQAGYYGCGRDSWPWIDHLLERLDLSSKRGSVIHKLSGGMKRRVLIAQALVHRPEVVILDEPTAGVDVELRRSLWVFMRELNAQGITVVLTTHYLEEAENLCERIAILFRGRLCALESTGTLIARHPFQFLSVRLGGRALPDGLRPLVASQKDGVLELKLHRHKHPIGEVLESLRSAGCAIEDIRTREPTLEEIFVDLTGEAVA
jgi:ABC-2 type transport system ATP-binding protein